MARFQRIPMDRQQLVEIMQGPDNEQGHGIRTVHKKETAVESVKDFIEACTSVYLDNFDNLEGLVSEAIGLKPEQRSDRYILFWWCKQPRFCYCADVTTGAFVYRADLGIGAYESLAVQFET